ncbi:MAG: MazG nucleotide pyrophosphohydrolase domain-containing protein [bacterium]|nr:MazG nucleotide pyrophosphohydrolase domain-containing protein [bacterium]
MNLNEAVIKTKEVSDSMPGKQWEIYQRFNDLVEEVGELANAIQVKEGWKSPKRSKADLTDSVCDVLYSIFCVAAIYNLDLEEEYPKVLAQIEERRKNGDFNHL